MSKFVYQLKAEGNNACFDGVGTLYSSTVFTTPELAAKRIPAFREKATSSEILLTLADNDRLKITVVKLEIVE